MRRLLAFLRQPYPIPEPPAVQVRRALLIGGFVVGFLAIFQPFGLNLWNTPHKLLKIAGFGGVTVVVTLLLFAGLPGLWPAAFREARWTTGRAGGLLLANVLLIAVANNAYLRLLLHQPWHGPDMLGMMLSTLAVAVFPVAATVVGTYVQQLRRYEQGAAALHLHPAAAAPRPEPAAPAPGGTTAEAAPPALPPAPLAISPPDLLTLVADNGKESLALPAADLLALEAADNYCTLHHRTPAGALTRTLLRGSLSRLAGPLLATEGPFGRCHRSWVVNLAQVERVTGTAQGYRLHLAEGALLVPVARQYNEAVVAALEAAD